MDEYVDFFINTFKSENISALHFNQASYFLKHPPCGIKIKYCALLPTKGLTGWNRTTWAQSSALDCWVECFGCYTEIW